MPAPPTVIIHNLAHARAAFAAAAGAGVAIRVMSAPGAAAFAGAGWFREVIAAARAEYPRARVEAVLDCGAESGLALGAMRCGVEAIRLKAAPGVRGRIAAIAQASGCRLVADGRGAVLDLLDARSPDRAARDWLARRHPRD